MEPPRRLGSLRRVSERPPPPACPWLTGAQCTGGRGQPLRAELRAWRETEAWPGRQGCGVLSRSCHLRGTVLPVSPTPASTSGSCQLGPGCPSAPPSLSPLLPTPSLCLTPAPSSLPIWHPQHLHSFSPPLPSPPAQPVPSTILPSVSTSVFVHPRLGLVLPHLSLFFFFLSLLILERETLICCSLMYAFIG